MIFMNPGEGATGTLAVDSGVEIVVEYTIEVAGTLTPHTKTFNSSRITYELHGTINKQPEIRLRARDINKGFRHLKCHHGPTEAYRWR